MAKMRQKQGYEEYVSVPKTEMFERIHKRTGLPVSMLSASCEAILEEVLEIVSEGNNAVFSGFGTFSVRKSNRSYNINKHVNPNQDQDFEPLPPHYSLKFVASRAGTKKLRATLEERGYEPPISK